MLLMAGGLFTACSADLDTPSGNADGSQVYKMNIMAKKGGGASNRALAEDGEYIRATWTTTDNVYVNKGSTWFTGSLQPQWEGKETLLSGVITGVNVNAGDEITLQFPKKGAITYDGQLGTLEDIAANFDWAVATTTVSDVDDDHNVSTFNDADFKNQQAILKLTLKDENGHDINAAQLKVTSGEKTFMVTPASATNVMYVAVPGGTSAVKLWARDGHDIYLSEIDKAVNGQFKATTSVMKKILEDAGDYIKVWTSPTKAYLLTKTDQSWLPWSNDPSRGSKEQWLEIFKTVSGDYSGDYSLAYINRIGYEALNTAVSNAGISGWTAMNGWYWSCSEVPDYPTAGWGFNNSSWGNNWRGYEAHIRTLLTPVYDLSVDGNRNDYRTTMAGDIFDDGEYIKVYTSPTGGFRISKTDTATSVEWSNNPSWGTQQQWQAVFIALGGGGNSGYKYLNDKVSDAEISGWTPMSGGYWYDKQPEYVDSSGLWMFYYIHNTDFNFAYTDAGKTFNARTISAFTD